MTDFSVERLPVRSISIGRVGENGYTTLRFDVSSWLERYPGARVVAVYRRPDGATYPVAGEADADGVLCWTVSDLDLSEPGYGELELRVMLGDMLGKSERVSLKIRSSLVAGERPAAPVADWIGQTVTRVNEAEKNALAADTNANAAATLSRAAAARAETASTSAQMARAQAVEAATRSERMLAENERLMAGDVFAGALRGSKIGEGAVLLDDVSTVSGTLECRAFGKNLIPFPYVDKTGKPYASAVQTVGGVTVTIQEDGGIALEGTAESVVDVALFAGELLLPAGWYTISGAEKREDITVYVRQLVHGVDTHFVNTYDGRNVKAEAFTVNRIGIYITAGTVVPAGTVIYPMFSMGNEAPSEYQRAGTVTLKACGKNLFDTSADVVKVWAYYGFDIKEKASIFGENLYLSIKLKPGKSIPPKIAFGFPYNYVEKDGRVVNNAILVLNNGSVVDQGLRIPVWYDTIGVGAYSLDTTIMSHAQAFEAVLDAFYVQLEVGTTKTDYVPFSFYEEYTVDENGEVNIPSVSPYMFIKDKDGTATLIVNYNRDINIALERIEQAIISMGGNV